MCILFQWDMMKRALSLFCFVLFFFSVVYYYFILKWYFKWCSQGTTGQFDFKQSAHRVVFSPVQRCPGSQGLGDL